MSNIRKRNHRKVGNVGEHLDSRKRPDRGSVSGRRQRMYIPESAKDPNYYYYWVNDDKDEINRCKSLGFEFVTDQELYPDTKENTDVETGSSLSSNVSMSVGQGVTAYLMKQPIDFREEDTTAMEASRKEIEDSMRRKNEGTDNSGNYGEVQIS